MIRDTGYVLVKIMLDIKFIRENAALVKHAAKGKRVDIDIDKLLKLDERRREHLHKLETARATQRRIGSGHQGKPPKDALAKLTALSDEIKVMEEGQRALKEEYEKLLWRVPNVVHKSVPEGENERGNVVVRQWGTPNHPLIPSLKRRGKLPESSFTPKEHWELGAALGVLDLERASQVSGSRFAYYKGKLALLQFALINFAFETLTNEKTLAAIAKRAKLKVSPKPFIPIIPPILMREEVMHKMARLEPREERYCISEDKVCLIGSAEHTLGPLHMDEMLDEKDLPIRYVGYSTCLRREAGTYGKDTKGIMRLHQFDKVEMESFTAPEQGIAEQDFLIAIQEYFMQELGLPYQVVFKCIGDMGAPDFREYDIEAWMPGQGKYRETHTADYMTDYQARRLNIRYRLSPSPDLASARSPSPRGRGEGEGKTRSEFVHTNDATALAMSRIPVAILENYQQKDGTIAVPKVLMPYTGFKSISAL